MSFLSSFLGGSLGFGDQSTTTSQQFNQNTNTSSNATGSTSRTLTPYQTALQSPLFNYITRAMTQPGAEATIAPFTAAAMDATNSTYAGLADTLRQQFMGTGGGNSGKFGTALAQGNLQRLGALQNVQQTGQEEAAALPLTAASLASQLLGMNFGETSTASSTGSSSTSGTSSGKSSSSGFSLGLGGGGSNI